MRRSLLPLAALALAACGQLPAQPPPPPGIGLTPQSRFLAAPADAPRPDAQDLQWWRRFGSPALAFWVERALQRNLDLALAATRVDEARALLRGAQGARGPVLSGGLRLTASEPRVGSARRIEPAASLGLDWDADLWGERRWAEVSAGARLLQAEHLARATRLSVAALTARAFLGWQEAKLEVAQIDASIALQREVARIVQVRVDAGLSPALDAQRARGELAATEAVAVDAASRAQDAAHALQLLAGELPGEHMPEAGAARLPELQGAAPVVLPVDLLRLRPDLQAAEQAWRAAVADLGVASAGRRPTLRLPGVLTLGTAASGAVLGQVTASIAAALAGPLFDGGQRAAGEAAAQARERAAALELQLSLRQALGEVEAALRASQDSVVRLEAQQRAVQEAEASVVQARALYTAGLAGFLDVLDAQRSALQRRQVLLRMRGDAARASFASFEALGLIDGAGAP